ncbi:acyl carrier protein [Shewanella halifaxensis]|uniref:acyl carrier protein n=1 Tax=Shewanella halifaxensis TaxID=271098 RepID=UPI000D59C62E|nr:acyl carrier protein [Shewanella halifaxensis]
MSFDNVKLLEIIAEVIEAEVSEITLESMLSDFYWDSLAVVTYITEVNSEFDKLLSPANVKAAKTVDDLVKLVQG